MHYDIFMEQSTWVYLIQNDQNLDCSNMHANVWYLLDLHKTWSKTKYIFTYDSIKILWTLVKQVMIVTSSNK